MKTLSYLIYDLEILKAIPSEPRVEGIAYCQGWSDYANMGISVIATMTDQATVRVFTVNHGFPYALPNFPSFVADVDLLVGFNSICFDDRVCAANGLTIQTDYDILREVYRAKGLDPYPEHYTQEYRGYGLEALCQANDLGAKTGNGALAPVWWQQKRYQQVIDYCIQDVRLTHALFAKILSGEGIRDPVSRAILYPRQPQKRN